MFQVWPACGHVAQLSADPSDYFPSVPIHEDDRVIGETHLELLGCKLTMTQFNPSSDSPLTVTITSINLLDFITNPVHINLPHASSSLSTRHMLSWFAFQMNDMRAEYANELLRFARLSFTDQRNLSDPKVAQKVQQIKSLLERIERGEFGGFAKANLTKRFRRGEHGLVPIGASVAVSFQIPVQKHHAIAIVREIASHRSKFCK